MRELNTQEAHAASGGILVLIGTIVALDLLLIGGMLGAQDALEDNQC